MKYRAFGLTFETDFPCPELVPCDGEPDVRISHGTLTDRLNGDAYQGACFRATPSRFLFEMPGVARYLVADGNDIRIDSFGNPIDESVRLFLLSPVMAALAHQRGWLALNGSCVALNGQGTLLLGRRGIGKSTLAAYLWERGGQVVADDLCLIRLREDGCPEVLPGYPRLKLYPDVLQHLGYEPDHLEPIRPGLQKRSLPVDPWPLEDPLPVTRLYVLKSLFRISTDSPDRPTAMPILGISKLRQLMEACANTYALRALYGEPHFFRRFTSLSQHVSLIMLVRSSASTTPLDLLNMMESVPDS